MNDLTQGVWDQWLLVSHQLSVCVQCWYLAGGPAELRFPVLGALPACGLGEGVQLLLWQSWAALTFSLELKPSLLLLQAGMSHDANTVHSLTP